MENKQPRKLVRVREIGAPYGNSGSYTPATDFYATPFVPSADRYSPPASNADPKEEKKP